MIPVQIGDEMKGTCICRWTRWTDYTARGWKIKNHFEEDTFAYLLHDLLEWGIYRLKICWCVLLGHLSLFEGGSMVKWLSGSNFYKSPLLLYAAFLNSYSRTRFQDYRIYCATYSEGWFSASHITFRKWPPFCSLMETKGKAWRLMLLSKAEKHIVSIQLNIIDHLLI